MDKQSIKSRLFQLKAQLGIIINKIEIERQDSKEDEQSVLNELLGNKSIVEQEIFNLESAINLLNIEKTRSKNYVLEKGKKTLNVSIVPESLVDNKKGFISKESPLAKAIVKTRVGDCFKIETPLGEMKYVLKEVVKA
jgi:transcription elongation GreA/GreB family factor